MVETNLGKRGGAEGDCGGSIQGGAVVGRGCEGDRRLTKELLETMFAEENPHEQFRQVFSSGALYTGTLLPSYISKMPHTLGGSWRLITPVRPRLERCLPNTRKTTTAVTSKIDDNTYIHTFGEGANIKESLRSLVKLWTR